MKKTRSFALMLILCLTVALVGCAKTERPEPKPNEDAEKAAVANLVETFGTKLQAVSLQAPPDQVKQSMQENYGDLVSPELLAQWQSDPSKAPGRLTSSPWPDRIHIIKIEKAADGKYAVQGEILEVTSSEKLTGGVAARRPITLTVEKRGDKWLITAVALGEYGGAPAPAPVTYKNTEYGFTFTLPASWQGYTIVTDKWEGNPPGGNTVTQSGPKLSIRHPQWTAEKPRQDIPIMVFTIDQWNRLQAGEFHIGAAPVGPRELGRNKNYVFALPARYNFAFPTGYEEVEQILAGNPLQPIE